MAMFDSSPETRKLLSGSSHLGRRTTSHFFGRGTFPLAERRVFPRGAHG